MTKTPGGDAHDEIEARAAEVVSKARRGPVRLRGRLLPSDRGELVLADATGRCPLSGVDEAQAYAWATIEGEAIDGRCSAQTIVLHTKPVRPRAHGELARFSEKGGVTAERLRLRARARRALREFFDARGYLEIETPALVPNPGSDLHLDAFAVEGHRAPFFLSTSPELQMKRLVAAGFDRIYQLRYAYRRDELGAHHEPEFTMLEWYRAFASFETLLDDTEALISNVIHEALDAESLELGPHRISLARPWPRRTIRELYRTYVDEGVDAFTLPDDTFFQLFAEAIQPRLGFERPEHVVEWPARFASLARLCPQDPSVAERVETFIAGIELSNGFVELTCPHEQRRRFEADEAMRRDAGKVVYAMDERFLDALHDGLPETVGNALGFDRLVMLMAGASEIAEVIALPHSRL